MVDVVTDRSSLLDLARSVSPGTRVPVEVRLGVEDPYGAYRRARDPTGGVFLETGGTHSGWGYFGVDPADRLDVAPADSDGERTTLGALGDRLDDESLDRGACDVPYPCGAVGWLSYDVARELEDLPEATEDDRGLPRLQVRVYDRLAAWRGGRSDVELRVCACPRIDDPDRPGDAYDRGRDRALDLVHRIREGTPSTDEPAVESGDVTFESDCGREAFRERVRAVKEYVRAGETFQANVSHRLRAPASVHPVAVFDALREVNPAPYAGLLEFDDVTLASASPELLLHVEEGRVVTEPIAGTRPRGDTKSADETLEADLLGDEKERAEHAMLVDLERNDLGKVCEYGSVEVPEYRRVDRYSAVMHLVSNVEGELRDDRSLADAIAAVFPGGTITGAPKPRTMEIIDRVEPTRRGPYTGSIGIFGFDDRATMNILIRTLVRHDGEYGLRVGAGIVHDSIPDAEYDETLDKARALIDAVDEALDRRTDLTVEEDE